MFLHAIRPLLYCTKLRHIAYSMELHSFILLTPWICTVSLRVFIECTVHSYILRIPQICTVQICSKISVVSCLLQMLTFSFRLFRKWTVSFHIFRQFALDHYTYVCRQRWGKINLTVLNEIFSSTDLKRALQYFETWTGWTGGPKTNLEQNILLL